ncbi:MAG: pentapeptide repeat-containing protein, partial [Marinomonas sp.]
MFELAASALALLMAHPSHSAPQTPEQAAEQAAALIKPVPADAIVAIRQTCALPAEAKFIDARHIASADELATMLEGLELDRPEASRTIVHGGKFVGEDIIVMLGKLEGGCIHDSDLSRTRAEAASFAGSSIINSSIERADWSSAILNETRLVGVNAKDAKLTGAALRGALWKGQNWKSNLAKADFTGALMLGFRFECGITMDESCGGSSGAKFDRADLSAADLAEFPTWGYDSFAGAVFEG